ncbi:MAG: phosphoribosylanthranilate isomerase [Archaeoglobaceae archaeon]|nr:phosphoribosylanthranilate isomerase [Archaeoglobaceae archaeon]MDW7989395.1 phosphoribosylanthranilate isomerase [Archaeoglobaceae archaeon]
MIIKICGIKNIRELEIVEKYADFGGVVVKSESKRCIALEKAKEIISNSKIPIFVVSTSEKLLDWQEIIAKTECDLVQIHGKMKVEDFERIREEVIVMKAFIVKNLGIFEEIKSYRPHYILLDSGCGSGKVHDWSVSREVAKRYPIILAGGLNKNNVIHAIEFVKPLGVDVSSGVEKNGFKDENLVSEFVKVVKNAFW